MRFQGEDDTSIHQTQVSVTAAMLNRGASVDEIVGTVLQATKTAAGAAGARWNWTHEERDIRAMCASWAKKKLNGQRAPDKHTILSVDELMTREFTPAGFLLPDLIPSEGTTLIATESRQIVAAL